MMGMSFLTFNQYHANIEPIRAREVLIDLKVMDFPKQSKDNRSKIHKHFYKIAHPRDLNTQEPLTTGDLVKRMRGMGV